MEVFSLAIAALGTGQSGVLYTLGYITNLFLSILLNLQVISKHTNCSCWPLFPLSQKLVKHMTQKVSSFISAVY